MNQFQVVGNLTADPELRFTPSGGAVVNFNIAQTPRKFDNQTKEWKDAGPTNYYRCTVWEQVAQNTAASLSKGDRVVVFGRLKTEKYERNGETVSSTNNLDVSELAASLAYAEVKITRNQKGNQGGNFGGGNQGGNNYSNNNQGGNQGGNNYSNNNQGDGGWPNTNGGGDEPPF